MDLILWTWVLIIKFSIQVETSIQFVAVQPLSRIRLFVTPWSAAHQALLSFAVSQSLLQFASICQWCCLTILPSVTPFKYLGLFFRNTWLCRAWSSRKHLFYTQEGWREGVGEIQSVCVSSLVSKCSEELVFRQHVIGHFIYSGKDYAISLTSFSVFPYKHSDWGSLGKGCWDRCCLGLRWSPSPWSGAPDFIWRRCFQSEKKKKKKWRLYCKQRFAQWLGQHTIVLKIFLCTRTCEFHL